MITNQHTNENLLTAEKSLADNCRSLCEKIVQQIGQAKRNILAEFQLAFAPQGQLLQLAILEADALAWQTDYPHLLFPTLAIEKIQQADQWKSRQQFLLKNASRYALAA